MPVSATIFYFRRPSFFPPTAMSDSKEHVASSFDNHRRYAECYARQIGALGERFDSPQGFDPRDSNPWNCPLRHGAYRFCIHCLATSLAAPLAPRELPPAHIRHGFQVRAWRISPSCIFISPCCPSFILSVTLIPTETLMTGPISAAACTFAVFASNVCPTAASIRPLYPDLLQTSLLFSAGMYFCMALNLQ
jgi:hypothetical protein